MITKIVKFNVQPEALGSFKSALVENQKGASTEEGCVENRLFADNKNPHLFFSYERYVDEAALEIHKQQTYTQKVVELVDTALIDPVECMNLGETLPAPVNVDEQKQPNPEDDVFVIIFIFKFKEGYREELLKRFEEHVTHTRTEGGCLQFDLYTVEGKNNTLAVYEHWRKESDVWDVHFKQPYSEITGALMHEAVVGDMEQYMNFVTEIKE